MKNREKYKNELVDAIKKDGKICEFVKKHEVWALGATSVTAEGDTERWRYCELVEYEEEWKAGMRGK